jgi:hypothetical protein
MTSTGLLASEFQSELFLQRGENRRPRCVAGIYLLEIGKAGAARGAAAWAGAS